MLLWSWRQHRMVRNEDETEMIEISDLPLHPHPHFHSPHPRSPPSPSLLHSHPIAPSASSADSDPIAHSYLRPFGSWRTLSGSMDLRITTRKVPARSLWTVWLFAACIYSPWIEKSDQQIVSFWREERLFDESTQLKELGWCEEDEV